MSLEEKKAIKMFISLKIRPGSIPPSLLRGCFSRGLVFVEKQFLTLFFGKICRDAGYFGFISLFF